MSNAFGVMRQNAMRSYNYLRGNNNSSAWGNNNSSAWRNNNSSAWGNNNSSNWRQSSRINGMINPYEGPSYVPFNQVMNRPFGIPPMNTRTSSMPTGLSAGMFAGSSTPSVKFRSSMRGNNPSATNTAKVQAGATSIVNAQKHNQNFTGIHNAETGTKFGQLTSPNGVKTRFSGNVENYKHAKKFVNTSEFTGKVTKTQFEDAKYRYTVTNRQGRLNAHC